MRVLGVDLSLAKCGLAVVENERLLFVATARPDRRLSQMGKRASVLKYIEALWEKYNFGLIVMESARLYTGGKNVPLVSIEAIISLSTTIEDWAQRTGNAGVVKVATNSWRKVVLGDGRAQKKDAQVYVLHHFRKDLNEDAAEAICQAVYGVKTWQP